MFRRRKQSVPTAAVVPYAFYHMQETRQATAGAMSYAFTPQRLLPPQPLVAGVPVRSRAVLPPPPVVAIRAGTQQGLGGIVAGQLVLQPLLVPPGSGGSL